MLDKYDKNRNPFKVPDNYFEGLTKDIMKSLPAKEDVKQAKKVTLWKKVLPWVGVAAAVTVIAISANLFKNSTSLMAEQDMDENKIEISTNSDQHLAYRDVEDYFLFMEEEAEEAEYIDLLFELKALASFL